MYTTQDAMNAYYGRDADQLRRVLGALQNPLRLAIGRHMETNKDIVMAIARVAHEVNRQYCISQGDHTQLPWENAPAWQQESVRKGALLHLQNPNATPKDSHESWMKEKEATGWKYGPVKDAEKKEHPCMVPYDQLDPVQRAKDYIFRGIVHAIAHEMVRT